jgi:hypothetical protein
MPGPVAGIASVTIHLATSDVEGVVVTAWGKRLAEDTGAYYRITGISRSTPHDLTVHAAKLLVLFPGPAAVDWGLAHQFYLHGVHACVRGVMFVLTAEEVDLTTGIDLAADNHVSALVSRCNGGEFLFVVADIPGRTYRWQGLVDSLGTQYRKRRV